MLQKQIVSNGLLSMDHYYLCSYLPVSSGKDELSKSLLRFKSRLEVDHQAWLECCLQELPSLVVILDKKLWNIDKKLWNLSIKPWNLAKGFSSYVFLSFP